MQPLTCQLPEPICDMSTDPAPQNTFLGFIQNVIHTRIYRLCTLYIWLHVHARLQTASLNQFNSNLVHKLVNSTVNATIVGVAGTQLKTAKILVFGWFLQNFRVMALNDSLKCVWLSYLVENNRTWVKYTIYIKWTSGSQGIRLKIFTFSLVFGRPHPNYQFWRVTNFDTSFINKIKYEVKLTKRKTLLYFSRFQPIVLFLDDYGRIVFEINWNVVWQAEVIVLKIWRSSF